MSGIKELKALFDRQKAAFAANPCPSQKEREDRLDAIMGAVLGNRDRIHTAFKEDFSAHPNAQADFIEIFGVVERLHYAKSMLNVWMARDERETNPEMFGNSKAYVLAQPKGVIGNMLPWNFPFDIGLGPLAEMLAGGNSVIIKPSDMTPACGALMKEILKAAISEDIVAVANGDVELAKVFPTLDWDHLMYTGNPDVARLVATAAAQNLTPLTLELGGKCPVILTEETVTPQAVSSILRTKMVKNGQMCISPDYALVPQQKLEDFVSHARQFFAESLPGYVNGDDLTGIINDRHMQRIGGLLTDLENRGARVERLGGGDPANGRRLPLSLAIDPPADSKVMREEVFGPILPVLPYDTLGDALSYVQQRDRPLGVYAFTDDQDLKERITSQTQSGGVSFNICSLQGALPNMGFGGSGLSGYGRHHGIEGFREFTNPRGFVDCDRDALVLNITPPYGDIATAMINGAKANLGL